MILQTLPKKRHNTITDDLVTDLNRLLSAEEIDVQESIVENFVTYSKIVQSGKYSIEQYLNAIKYVSFKLMDYSNIEAYQKAYPERYEKHIRKYEAEGYSPEKAKSKIGSVVNSVAYGTL